jgi:anhydro-N-acetylmuramic acid kinase
MTASKDIYIGLMSGTSLDSIDAVAVVFTPDFQLIASHTEEIPDQLKDQIRQLMLPGNNEIDLLGIVDIDLGKLFADAVNNLITDHQLDRSQIRAIGSHGQTIRHRPDSGFTLQIGDANVIAEQTQITTVADFRRRDMAAGGQGAPLVPAFHEAMFRTHNTDRVLLNIGGMANITYLPKNLTQPVLGFDTGPGNILLNAWIEKQKGQSFDKDGEWATSGKINYDLLRDLLNEEYFKAAPPKSTGRELFNLKWLENILEKHPQLAEADVQATLSMLTVETIKDSLLEHLPTQNFELFVCGGGSHNKHLMQQLQQAIPEIPVAPSDNAGLDADWMEACAFTWLAKQCLEGKSGNSPKATGACGARVLGAIYHA